MTKSAFKKKLEYQFNETRMIDKKTVMHIAWLDKPWIVLHEGEQVEAIRARQDKPIESYRTSMDMYEGAFAN